MTTTIDPAVSNASPSPLNVPEQCENLSSIETDHHRQQQTENLQENHSTDPIVICQILGKQNDALREELHDIRREMEEIHDQFRTEDAEEFKQLQVELDISAKTCRILQFKLRKAEKRSENLESEKAILQEKLDQIIENHRFGQNVNEELFIAKEVSVRLHAELEKSEQARRIAEKLNETLKNQLKILKTSFDQPSDSENYHDFYSLELSVALYEALLREYVLIEELTCFNGKFDQQQFNELIRSYQEKIDSLNEEILQLKQKSNQNQQNEIIRDLQQKIEDFQSKSNDEENLRNLSEKIDRLLNVIRENRVDSVAVRDLQQQLKSSRWIKNSTNEKNPMSDKISTIYKEAAEFLDLFKEKENLLESIHDRLKNFESERNENRQTIEKLETKVKQIDEQFQRQLNLNENLRKSLEEEKSKTLLLNEDKNQLAILNKKQTEELQHLEQLKQSIVVFEKKLDQKQTRVNELSMKIIEKEDIIENKVKECHKHRLELKDLESKYFNLGKQLEEQIGDLNKEIHKLNAEKETLKSDLENLRVTQETDRNKFNVEEELTRVKNECRQQIIDGEISAFKLRLNQLNNEKDELIKNLRQLEKKHRDLQIKNDADELFWSRTKTEMIEKQKKYDDAIKMKSELQNAVDRLRQKLYDLEMRSQEKQNQFNIDKNHWEIQTLEWIGKINELEEQLSKVNKRQRKDIEISWKKERIELQKQIQQCQEMINELQNQLIERDQPLNFSEKLNVLLTENELLLNRSKEMEIIVDNVQLLKSEVQRLKDKNSSDWNYWRKQQSDLYAQLRQQINLKESIFYKFERLEKQIKVIENENSVRFIRDTSVGPISLNSFQNETSGKTSLSSFARENFLDEIDLPHGTIDGRPLNAAEIVGGIDESTSHSSISNYVEQEKQKLFDKTFSAQEKNAENLEEIADKIDRIEDHLFSYRRFMDFIRSKSEKSSSSIRDESLTKLVVNGESLEKRSVSLLTETNSPSACQRRSRFDVNPTLSQDSFRSIDDSTSANLMSTSMNENLQTEIGTSKNRFFSLSRRFRFRTQSAEKSSTTNGVTVHFLDQEMDLETKETTSKKVDQRPSKGILKSLRHRSPFRFRSKEMSTTNEKSNSPPMIDKTKNKSRSRIVQSKQISTDEKISNNENNSTTNLFRRTSGLKDLIHKFEATPSNDRSTKTKRVTIDENRFEQTTNEFSTSHFDRHFLLNSTNKSKTVDIPDLLRNVEKETSNNNKPILRHSNSARQTTSFDSTTSAVSANESIATNNSGTTRKPTSTARPLMLAINKEES